MRTLLAVLLLAVAGAAAAGDAVVHAYVYDLETDQYLYTEVHEQKLAGGKVASSRIQYVLPNGETFGHKTIDFSTDEFVPVYRLDMTQEGYAEGIAENGSTITMMRQHPRASPETETMKKDGAMAADAGMLRLLRANLDALARGETLQFRVLAPSRLDAYKFRARRIADTTFEGKPATRIQVDMDSMLKLFAGPLLFTFDANRKLVEFRGPTNVRNPATGKDYHVRLAFYSTPPKDAPKLP
jgi:hypothetical protein